MPAAFLGASMHWKTGHPDLFLGSSNLLGLLAEMSKLSFAIHALAPVVIAFSAWLSLNPYFVWGNSEHLRLAAAASALVAVLSVFAGGRPRKGELGFFAFIVTFVVYISILPTVDGEHIRWVYVLPMLGAMCVLDDAGRAATMRYFSGLFAISLVPAIAVAIWCIAGLPVTFQSIPHLNSTMAEAGARYLMLPGVLLLESNSLQLPWGGVLFRLCAVYDEPGMVGTVGALVLLASRFDLRSPVVLTLLAGGALSFSVAFFVLAACGLAYRTLTKPSPWAFAWLAIVGLSGALALGIIRPDTSLETPRRITVVAAPANPVPEVADPTEPPPPTELRQTDQILNRSLPEMDRLIAEFWSSDLQTLVFGMGSDASVVKGGVSAVIDRIYTDYGLAGFLLYVLGFGWLCAEKVRRSDDRRWTALFVAMFVLSTYQRPVIWLPYTLLILICGSIGAPRANSQGTVRAERARQN